MKHKVPTYRRWAADQIKMVPKEYRELRRWWLETLKDAAPNSQEEYDQRMKESARIQKMVEESFGVK